MRVAVLLLLALSSTLLLDGRRQALAHALDPGFLELRALGNDRYAVSFKVPQIGGRPMAIRAVLPENCVPRSQDDVFWIGQAFAVSWVVHCPGGLRGRATRHKGHGSDNDRRAAPRRGLEWRDAQARA